MGGRGMLMWCCGRIQCIGVRIGGCVFVWASSSCNAKLHNTYTTLVKMCIVDDYAIEQLEHREVCTMYVESMGGCGCECIALRRLFFFRCVLAFLFFVPSLYVLRGRQQQRWAIWGNGMGKKIRIDAKYILTELSAFNVKSIRIT